MQRFIDRFPRCRWLQQGPKGRKKKNTLSKKFAAPGSAPQGREGIDKPLRPGITTNPHPHLRTWWISARNRNKTRTEHRATCKIGHERTLVGVNLCFSCVQWGREWRWGGLDLGDFICHIGRRCDGRGGEGSWGGEERRRGGLGIFLALRREACCLVPTGTTRVGFGTGGIFCGSKKCKLHAFTNFYSDDVVVNNYNKSG